MGPPVCGESALGWAVRALRSSLMVVMRYQAKVIVTSIRLNSPTRAKPCGLEKGRGKIWNGIRR